MQMKSFQTIFSLLLLFTSSWATAEVEPPFKLDFSNGLIPLYRGDIPVEKRVMPETSVPAEYRQGLTGDSIFLGSIDHTLKIPSVEHYVPGEEYTLVFWVKKQAGSEYRILTGGASGTMHQRWWQTLLSYDGIVDLPVLSGTTGPAKWDMIAITGDAKGRNVYRDGLKAEERGPREFKGDLVFGHPYPAIDKSVQPELYFDEITIFDKKLDDLEIFQLYISTADIAREPVMSVLPSTADITIDGSVNAGEWQHASKTGGFAENRFGFNAETPTWAFACYDSDNLYIAIVSETPSYALERVEDTIGMRGYVVQSAREPDEQFLQDDRLKITLATDYENPADIITIEFNNAGVVVCKRNGESFPLSPVISTSTDIYEGWQAEIAIPWDRLDTRPAPGDEWGLNIERIWKALQENITDTWAFGKRRADDTVTPVPLGMMVFEEDSDIEVRMNSTGEITEGEVDISFDFTNRGSRIRTLSSAAASAHTTAPLDISTIQAGATREYRHDDTVTLPPGETRRVELKTRLKDIETRWFTVVVSADGKQLVRKQFPVFLASLMGAETAHYPSMELYRIRPDISRAAEEDLALLTLKAYISREDEDTPLAEGLVQSPENRDVWIDIDTSDVPGGSYLVHYSVTKGDDIFSRGSVPFRKKPLESFAWYKNNIGKSDRIPEPFTPVKRDGETLNLFNRQYIIGTSLLPEQIINTVPEWSAGWVADKTLEAPGLMSRTLSGPISLNVKDSQSKEFISTDGMAEIEWGQENDTRVEWSTSQKVGPANIRAEYFMEFDGFMWVKMEIEAAGDIEYTAIEIPFRSAWASLVNYSEYGPRYNGVFPGDFEHPYEHPVPVWIGNEIGGTQWIVATWASGEHDFRHSRRLKAKTPGLLLEKEGETHKVTIILSNEPLTAGEKLNLEFGFITTPVKPIKTDRLVESSQRIRASYAPYWNIKLHEFDPSHSIGELGRLTDIPGGPMYNSGTYVTIGRIRDVSPDIEYWADDFMLYPARRNLVQSYGRGIYDASTASESYRDYYVWWVAAKQAMRQRVAGSYYDTNVTSGGASVLEGRDLVKRIYLAFLESEEETAVQFHMSGQWFGAWQFSFNDSHVDGENFVSRLTKEQPGYHHHYPIDAFRTQLNSYQFGLRCSTLDQFSRSGAIPATEEAWSKWGSNPVDFFMALCYLHYDVAPSPAYAYQPFVKKWTDAAEEYGLFKTRLPHDKFFPYWTQDIAELPEGVYGSFYFITDPRRTILIAANYNEEELPLSIPIDMRQLGYRDGEKIKVVHTVPDKTGAAIENGMLNFTVGKAGGTMLVLEAE